MKYLPPPPNTYDVEYFSKLRDSLTEIGNNNLELNSDNFIEDGSLCLKSPNGTWFRLTVDNSGNVSTSTITVDSANVPIQSTNPYA